MILKENCPRARILINWVRLLHHVGMQKVFFNIFVKSGHIRGIQRYQCKDCRCQFTDTKIRGVSPILKKLAVVLYAHCGVPMLGIAKLLKVSDVAVLKWIRKAASLISDPAQTEKPKAQTVQIDETSAFC